MEEFADLHCHPHMRSFNWLRHSKYEKRSDLRQKFFHPWFVVWSKLKSQKKGSRACAYSQSDLIKLKNGNVKLAFVSLYPMEKEWFRTTNNMPVSKILNILDNATKFKFLQILFPIKTGLTEIIYKLRNDEGERIAFRDIVQAIYMKFPIRRINFLQSNEYDYFEELQKEKDFLTSKNNIESESEIYIPTLRNFFLNKKKLEKKKEFYAKGTYEIAKNGKDVERITKEGKMAFVLTIEGANVFNTYKNNVEKIKERIMEIKNWKSRKPTQNEETIEDTPIFYISFAHHFYNHLCGHAHSIPDIASFLLDQSEGMNTGFTDKGKEIIHFFLSLTDTNTKDENKLGRRILIDIKHMSVNARKYYYEEIIRPCRAKKDYIPIIASHCAYAGKKTINELIKNSLKEADNEAISTINKPFNTWNINLCDEDIIEIFKSGGIIGFSLDQRLLGEPKKKKNKIYPANYDISFFWGNLKGMMDVIINSTDPEIKNKKKGVINLFGIGSDFDGYIDPLDKYSTTLHFNDFSNDLQQEIEHDEQKDTYLFGLTSKEFVEKICYNNAYRFVVDHFK